MVDSLMQNSYQVRVTPLTLAAYVDPAHRNGRTSVSWRSVTQSTSYSLSQSLPVQHRTIVFRTKSVPQDLSTVIRKRALCTEEFARTKLQHPQLYMPWFHLLFDRISGGAVMVSPAQGHGVTILSDYTHSINVSGEGGRNSKQKKATMLKSTLDYVDSNIGTGGSGPAFMMEIYKVGHPSQDQIGIIRRPEVKIEGEEELAAKMETDSDTEIVTPPKRKKPSAASSSGPSYAPLGTVTAGEVVSTAKIYYY